MELKNYFIQDSYGNKLPYADGFLYLEGTTTLASGLEDVNGDPLSNPVSSGSGGLIQFAAPNGRYDLLVQKGSTSYSIKVQCNDVLDSMGAVVGVRDQAQSFSVDALSYVGQTQTLAIQAQQAALDAEASATAAVLNLADPTTGPDLLRYTPPGAGASTETLRKSLDRLKLRPETFGAVGDGIAEDYPAWNLFLTALLATGKKGEGTPGAKYKISTPLSRTLVEGNVLSFDMNDSCFVQGGNNTVLTITNSLNGLATLATENIQVSYNLGNGATNTYVMKVTSVGHGFTAPGQIGKIFSDDLVPDSDGANQMRGEFFLVSVVESADIFYTFGVFEETYSTNVKVCRPSNASVTIDNLSGKSVWQDSITASYFTFTGLINPVLGGIVKANDINAVFLNLTGNYRAKLKSIIGRNIKNRPDLGAYGYLVNDSAGWRSDISGIDCIYARHAYTTSTPTSAVPNDDKWMLRGRTINSEVYDGVGQACANPFDTHSPAKGITFRNLRTIDDFRGNDTGGAGIQIRGNDCRVINCDVSQSKIGIAQSGASKTTPARLSIEGLKYRGPYAHTPVIINGSTNFETVVNFQGDIESQASSVFEVTNATLIVNDTRVTMNPTDNGAAMVNLNTGGNLDWQSGYLTITSGNSHKVVEHLETGTTAKVEGLTIRGVTGRLSYLAASAAQYAIESRFRKIQLDAVLPGTPFLGAEATSPKLSADFCVGYNQRPLGYRVFTYGTGGNQSLDFQFAGNESIFVRIEATVTGVVINSVTQGAFAGQRLIINNRNSSAFSINIANNSGGLLTLGTSATLTAARGITLVWDGSTWRSADNH